MRALVLNGPNLGRLGTREPEVYGTTTYSQLVELCERCGGEVGLDVEVRQTDDEATMLGWLHEAADTGLPVVLNAGAWSHYSYAVRDAAAEVGVLVEVHISAVHRREDFRRTSVISPVATGVVTGLGVEGYRAALRYLAAAR